MGLSEMESAIVSGDRDVVDSICALALARLMDLATPDELDELRKASAALARARMTRRAAYPTTMEPTVIVDRLDNAEAGQARTEVYVDWGEPVSAFPDGEPPIPDVWRKIAEW